MKIRNKILNLLLLLVMAGCASPAKDEAPAEEKQPEEIVELSEEQLKNAGIVVGQANDTVVSSELRVNGMIDVPPQNIVSVSFPLGGYLKSTKLLPGMHVSRGEVIGMIEDQALVQLQQDYLVTKSKLEYLRQEYERQKLLNEQQVNAGKVFEQAATDYRSQQVLLKGFSEKLQLVGIDPARLDESNLSRSVALRSPINGYVSRVNVNIGKYVNPTDVLFELINPDDMHGALTVFEKDISKVRIGQKVIMQFVDDPERTYNGEVIVFTRNVDESRSGIVHCHFETMPKNLMPGMFLNARILLDKRQALVVPDEAIVRFGGRQYVFAKEGPNSFRMVEVKVDTVSVDQLGITSADQTLKKSQLVLRNAHAVLGKMKNTAEEE